MIRIYNFTWKLYGLTLCKKFLINKLRRNDDGDQFNRH
jgi:hypothetical protein